MVSRNTLAYTLKGNGDYPGLKQKAGIDKPMNPHAIRHNFVTIARREHDMDGDDIKRLIGHSPDSQVMETTYAHLSDDDVIKNAEVAFGIRDEDEKGEGSLTPSICNVCGEALTPGAKACPRCGTVYAPDAKAAIDDIRGDAVADLADPETTDEQRETVAHLLDAIQNNPDVAAAVADAAANADAGNGGSDGTADAAGDD